jgi:hypothetical protein
MTRYGHPSFYFLSLEVRCFEPQLGLAPESALSLLPSRCLSSAPVTSSVSILEREFIRTGTPARSVSARQLGLDDIDVAFVIGRNLVTGRMLLRCSSDE